jgi:DNA-binding response OmpR family regulator
VPASSRRDDERVGGIDVLVVEDSPEFADLVFEVLDKAGHQVRAAATIRDAERVMSTWDPDLVVLDLTLPDGDGLDLCRAIRERSNAFILMLKARSEDVDRVLGFRFGADDYVPKPFSPRELEARVEALARRPRDPKLKGSERMVGDLVVRPLEREVVLAGKQVELTRIEFGLLDALTVHPRRVLTRAELLARVWGDDWYGDDHVVDVHIANLRKKLAAAADHQVVRTVRGVGYGLVV